VDLARLAGLHPSGVICEVMKDDGTMARVPDLVPFCRQHGLPLVTVADLVAYRLRQEPLVKPLEVRSMPSVWGELKVHRFQSLLDGGSHLAFVLGDLAVGEPPLVRVHVETLPDDLHGFETGLFQKAMGHLAREGRGALVYLRRHAHTPGVAEEGPVQPQSMSDREFGVGAQILRQLGIGKMRLLSRHETKYIGLRGFGLDLCAHVPLEATAAPFSTDQH
jgi:3,4-dihydroxy 2-butanone 4-phosphate synthase/GTP cyclohydrolase II